MFDIRRAEKYDISVLYGLSEALSVHKSKGYFERCLDERQVFIVKKDKDIAYGMLNWRPQYALYKRLGIPEIQDLNVIPEARQQGVATALIKHCETLAKAENCDHIGISVGLDKSYGPAQRLYAKLGYVPDGNGVSYERKPVAAGETRPVDDDLCLMLVKSLEAPVR